MLTPLLLSLLLALCLLPSARQESLVPQAAINNAVDLGVDWLLDAQRRDGSWGENDLTPGGHRDPRNDLTAFCTYTLLKCKVRPEHPAIRRALAYLEQGQPCTTYAIATEVLALTATEDPRFEKRLEDLVENLLDLRWPGHNTWGYPGHPSIQTDLSNTQYAALALRAAERAGIAVPDKVWIQMAERVLKHQEEPRSVEDPAGEGTATQRQEAGFAYLLPNPQKPSVGYNVPNASMTAAGLALLRIAEEGLGGKLPRKIGRDGERAKQHGRAWLDGHFSMAKNVAGEQAWIYYYLYGIERVGALYDTDLIAGHDWYQEGARELVKWQTTDGNWQQGGYRQWPRQPMPHANTCFALLFLVKATRGSATGDGMARKSGIYVADDPSAEVRVRATGRSELAIWVTGFGESIVEDYTLETPDATGMFVLEVRYLLDGEVVARMPGSPERPWKDERYAVKHAFERNGKYELEVQVVVRDDGVEGDRAVLTSTPLTVRARDVLEDWMLDCATIDAHDLVDPSKATVSASSHRGEWATPDRAIDGLQASRWLSKADDPEPTLVLEFRRPVRAEALILTQADSTIAELGRHAHVKRVSISINGDKKPFEADLDLDPMRPTRIVFPKRARVRRLAIRILDYEPGREFKSEVGFAEVGLVK